MRKFSILVASLMFFLAPASAFAIETWSYFNVIGEKVGGLIQPGFVVPPHVVTYFTVALMLVIMGVIIGGSYRGKLRAFEEWKKQPVETRGKCPIEPQSNFSLSNFFEAVLQAILGLMDQIIGHGSKKYLPLIGSLTFVILFSNCLGLLPSSAIPTSNLNTNAAMAITVFLLYHFFGIREHGILKYLGHFMGPLEGSLKYIMAPLMIPIELIGHFARPLSLTLRLFGNMFGDHTLFAVFMGLVAIPLIYPLPFYFLGLLVSVVQTLVFIMLSMVYISMAVAHDH